MKHHRLPNCIIHAIAMYYATRELSREYYMKEQRDGFEMLVLRKPNKHGFQKDECLKQLFEACERTDWVCSAIAGTFFFSKTHRVTIMINSENFPYGELYKPKKN